MMTRLSLTVTIEKKFELKEKKNLKNKFFYVEPKQHYITK